MTKTCLTCQKEFLPLPNKKATQKWCSRPCWIAYEGDYIPKICERCGITFSVMPYRSETVRFCSVTCRQMLAEKQCEFCNTTYYIKFSHADKRKTCSRFCAMKLRAKLGYSPRQGKILAEKYRVQISAKMKQYHKEHPQKHPLLKDGAYRDGLTKDKRGPNWLEQRKAARLRDECVCQCCGITEEQLGKKLSAHHIVSYHVFASYQLANVLDNLISLCQPCHMRVEHNHAELPIKLVQRAEALPRQ